MTMRFFALASCILLSVAGAAACGGSDSGGGSSSGSGGSGGGSAGSAGSGGGSTCDQQGCMSCLNGSDPTQCETACAGCSDGSGGGAGSGGGSAGAGGSGGGTPTGKAIGESCTADSDCQSQDCPFGLSYCTIGCTDWSDCPSFWTCKPVGASSQMVCQKN